MTDQLIHYHMFDYRVRCVVAVVTETTRELQRRHGLDPLTTIAGGRAMACSAMLASTLKNASEFIHCLYSGRGMITRVVAECNGVGHCRGYISPARLEIDLEQGGKVPGSVGEALGGGGVLTVTRGRYGERTPYTAVCELQNGEIASDIARYLTESEQIPSAVAAGVRLGPQGEVLAAGGVLVQKLAGTELPDAVLSEIEARMRQINLSDRLATGAVPDSIVAYLQGEEGQFGRLTVKQVAFKCRCSREQMASALRMLGEVELKSIQEETGRLEVRCPYCADTHNFRLHELTVH